MDNTTDVIECDFQNETALYLAYMPFIKNGGIFIRTKIPYSLGQKLTLSLQLMSETEKYVMEGSVVWITPPGAQGNKPVGIGIQFLGENSRPLCNKIETHLAGMLKSTQITDTM